MRGKLWFLGGAAVGFVIGARAGRERYDQLVRATRNMWDHPTTQEAAGVVQEQASRLYAKGKDTVSGKLGHRAGDVPGTVAPDTTAPDTAGADTLTGVTRPSPHGPPDPEGPQRTTF
jgi:hypothetical protein